MNQTDIQTTNQAIKYPNNQPNDAGKKKLQKRTTMTKRWQNMTKDGKRERSSRL